MTNATKPIAKVHNLLDTHPAANADQIGEGMGQSTIVATETSVGWDAYDVWRRFIKEARDRRRTSES